MRTTLESGAWIEHVPVQALTYGHKRALSRAARMQVPDGALDDEGSVSMRGMLAGMDITAWTAAKQDALWALLITAWSWDTPVPALDKGTGEITGGDALDGIPIDDADEIEAILAPHAEKLARRPDPKGSTTSGSSGSSPARGSASRKG